MSARRRLLVAAAAASLPALLIGAHSGAQTSQARAGEQLWRAHCASCHGVNALGTSQGPSLAGRGPAALHFVMSTGRMPLADPGQQAVRNPPQLTPEEIAAVVEYASSLVPGGPPIPDVDPGRGTLEDGREIYAAGCIACHGPAGGGGAIGGGQIAPSLHRSDAVQVAEAVRIGPATMPPFGPEVISDDDLDSLVSYVLHLRETADPGGAPLGYVGPVAEGFIAWFVGLGLVLIVVRVGSHR